MFGLYDAMQKWLDYCPRGYIEGGYYLFTRPSSAGIIRMRVLIEGGSYMRKYGRPKNQLGDFVKFLFSFRKT